MKKRSFLSRTVLISFFGIISFVLLFVIYNFIKEGKTSYVIGVSIITILLLFGAYLQLTIRTDE